eukprot:sb/3468706/
MKIFHSNLKNCKTRCTTQEALYTHIRQDHPLKNDCSMSFDHKCVLQKHSTVHSDEKPFQCDKCDMRFKHFGTRDQHKKLHITKFPEHQCDICGARFTRRSGVKHHKRRHTGEKPFPCTFCEELFIYAGDRSKHELTCPHRQDFVNDQNWTSLLLGSRDYLSEHFAFLPLKIDSPITEIRLNNPCVLLTRSLRFHYGGLYCPASVHGHVNLTAYYIQNVLAAKTQNAQKANLYYLQQTCPILIRSTLTLNVV